MTRKWWEGLEMALYLAAMILILAYAISGLYETPGWHQ